MMHFEGRDRVGPTLQDAEALVRSLVGVAAVRIITAPDGSLREIVVVPESDASIRQVSRNVTSALMAGFGVDLNPDAISIAGPHADNSSETGRTSSTPATEPDQGPPGAAAATDRKSPHGPGSAAPRTRNGVNGNHGSGPKQNGAVHADAASHAVTKAPPAEPAAPVRAAVRVHAPVRPRLELVELTRAAGSVRCRVVVATGTERFVGVGNGDDQNTADFMLAGRVAVDALRVARTPRDPIQFDGAAEIDIAGRRHIAISLSLWTGSDFEAIAGAAPVLDSPAEAAAQAVIDTIVAHLIA